MKYLPKYNITTLETCSSLETSCSEEKIIKKGRKRKGNKCRRIKRKKENSSVEETITLMGVFNDRWKTKIKYYES